MPILRGHHLICLHFFNGEGYDEAFVNNLAEVMKRTGNEYITVVEGADDVCAYCLYCSNGVCSSTVNAESEIRDMDDSAIRLLGIPSSTHVTWALLRKRIPGIFPEWHSLYCRQCDWKTACDRNIFFHRLQGAL